MNLSPSFLSFMLTAAMAGVCLCGCATAPEASLASWEGVELKAIRMVSGGLAVALPENYSITLKLEPDGKVSGRSAVNRYFGAFSKVSDGTILWQGSLGATRMAGPPVAMQLETEFFKTLTSTTIVRSGATTLTFKSADGKNLVEFGRP
ncbi:MAG TPA: META domain-containing protein [Verrucomicrobiota bacterium]|nr:META domain-containing protein [Verrucomicrobiota bacterium]